MSEDISNRVQELITQIQAISENPGTKPTLVYFDIIGICWPVRCLLHLKNVDYDLLQITVQRWAYRDAQGQQPLKVCFRNGHVPLYVDSNVVLNQSNLIMAYLGEKHDLLGDNTIQKYEAMEVMAHAYDALFHFSGLFQTNIKAGISDDVVSARLEAFLGNGSWGLLSNGYKNNLDAFQRYLDSNTADSGFMVGTRISVADLHAFNVLCNWYKAFDSTRFSKRYPRLDDYIHRIAAIPQVGDYIRNKQEATTWFQLPEFALKLTSPADLVGLVDPG